MVWCSFLYWHARLLLRCETVHESVHSRGTETKVAMKANKVILGKWLCEDVCNIVNGLDISNSKFVIGYQIMDSVVLDTNMLYLWVPNVVFSQTTSSVIVVVADRFQPPHRGSSGLRR